MVYQDPMDSEVNPDHPDLLVKPVSVETLDLPDLQVLLDREELREQQDNQVKFYLLWIKCRSRNNPI